MKILIAFVLSIVSLINAQGMVKLVDVPHTTTKEKLPTQEKIMNALQQQITVELQASYMYQAYASYFGRADVALPGFQKFFAAASLEERGHAEKLIEYVNKRGGNIEFPAVKFDEQCDNIRNELESIADSNENDGCICYFVGAIKQSKKSAFTSKCPSNRGTWKHGLYAMQDTLAIERVVYQNLYDLLVQAGGDPVLSHLLEHEYLEEQADTIKKLGDHVTRLQRFADASSYAVGEYMVDSKL